MVLGRRQYWTPLATTSPFSIFCTQDLGSCYSCRVEQQIWTQAHVQSPLLRWRATQASLILKCTGGCVSLGSIEGLRDFCVSNRTTGHQNSMFHASQEGASVRHLSILFHCLCSCATVNSSARNSRKHRSITRHNKAHATPSSLSFTEDYVPRLSNWPDRRRMTSQPNNLAGTWKVNFIQQLSNACALLNSWADGVMGCDSLFNPHANTGPQTVEDAIVSWCH